VCVLSCPFLSIGYKQKRVEKEGVGEVKEDEEEDLVEFPLTFYALSTSYFNGVLYGLG